MTPALNWNAEALWLQLEPLRPGLTVEVVADIASTNTALLTRARGADTSPCLLVAEQQSGGRGRQGRAWQSQRGASLTFSLALPFAPPDWSGLSLAVGVALAEALDAGGGPPRIGLKWPNDLWLMDDGGAAGSAGRKLGGILIETVSAGAARTAVIGVGLNVLPFAPAELASGIAFVQELDAQADAPQTLARVAPPLLQALQQFERDGFAPFAARFAARDVLFGRALRTTQPGAEAGAGEGVSASGALRLRGADGLLREVVGGEVSVRIAAAAAVATGAAR